MAIDRQSIKPAAIAIGVAVLIFLVVAAIAGSARRAALAAPDQPPQRAAFQAALEGAGFEFKAPTQDESGRIVYRGVLENTRTELFEDGEGRLTSFYLFYPAEANKGEAHKAVVQAAKLLLPRWYGREGEGWIAEHALSVYTNPDPTRVETASGSDLISLRRTLKGALIFQVDYGAAPQP